MPFFFSSTSTSQSSYFFVFFSCHSLTPLRPPFIGILFFLDFDFSLSLFTVIPSRPFILSHSLSPFRPPFIWYSQFFPRQLRPRPRKYGSRSDSRHSFLLSKSYVSWIYRLACLGSYSCNFLFFIIEGRKQLCVFPLSREHEKLQSDGR